MARQDIGYDLEDFGMTAVELEAKYAPGGRDEHPTFVRPAYMVYAAMPTRDVKLGYWDWVAAQIKKDDATMPSNVPEPSAGAFQDQLTEEQVMDAELIQVESMDQFAAFIAHWHSNVMGKLNHLMEMPEGQTVELQIQGKPEEKVILTGEAFAGFRAGLLTAILQFDSLPFAVSVADAIDAPVGLEPDADAPKH